MLEKLRYVLLIDDDDASLFIHEKIIEFTGSAIKSESFRSAQHALAYLKSSPENDFPVPDLILLDLNMPIMNGWEFLREFKKLKKSKRDRINIIMLTSSIDPADERKARGFNEVMDFISKPLTPNGMLSIVSRILKKG